MNIRCTRETIAWLLTFPKAGSTELLILIVMEKVQQEIRIEKTCNKGGGLGKDATRNQDPEKMQQKMRIRKDATKAAKPLVITSQSRKVGGVRFGFLFIGKVWYCSKKIDSTVSKINRFCILIQKVGGKLKFAESRQIHTFLTDKSLFAVLAYFRQFLAPFLLLLFLPFLWLWVYKGEMSRQSSFFSRKMGEIEFKGFSYFDWPHKTVLLVPICEYSCKILFLEKLSTPPAHTTYTPTF